MNIWLNIALIVGVIVILVLMRKILDKVFFNWTILISESLGKKLGKRIKKHSTIFIMEISILLLLLLYVISHLALFITTNFRGVFFLIWGLITFLFIILFFMFNATVHEFKLNNTEYSSIIGKRVKKMKLGAKANQIYLLNRFGLFMQQIPDFFKSLVILQLSFLFLITLKWSPNFYFLSLCFIPLYANYWVYFVKILTINTKADDVFIRRAFIYLCLIAVGVYELFTRFENYMYERPLTTSIDVFLLTGSGILYIAIDRVLKEVSSDYLKFKNEQSKLAEAVE